MARAARLRGVRRRAQITLLVAPVAVTAVGLSACGNSQTKAPDVTSVRPAISFVRERFPSEGVSFERPKDWLFTKGTAPLLATVSAGRVTVAVWRYPRTEALPVTTAALRAATHALVTAAKARDSTLTVQKAKGTRAAHEPAVVLIADETVAGQPRTVRSTHVYAHGGEVVVDAFAPPGDYPKVEAPVFRRIVRSLRLAQPAQ
jgi:hypothetical protein